MNIFAAKATPASTSVAVPVTTVGPDVVVDDATAAAAAAAAKGAADPRAVPIGSKPKLLTGLGEASRSSSYGSFAGRFTDGLFRRRVLIVHPESHWYVYWQTGLVVLITIGCVLTIYQASIDSTAISGLVIVYFIDAVNLADTVLTVFVGYFNSIGALIIDRRKIWNRYVRGTFAINVLSLLPIEIFSLLPVFESRVVVLSRLRLNRLIALVKVYKIINIHMSALGSDGTLWQVALCLFCATFTVHIPACVWFVLACSGNHDGVEFVLYNNTWTKKEEGSKTKGPIEANMTKDLSTENYLTSLYYIVTTTTTTGYGDLSATNIQEIIVALLIMVMGVAVFFGLILGVMSSLVTNLMMQMSTFMHKIDIIQLHLVFRDISKSIQSRVIGYYEYLYLKKRADSSNSFLEILPDIMKVEFNYSTHLVIINKAKIFSGLDVSFLRMLSLKMKQKVYLPDQIVASRGEIGHEMFYIHHGELEILSEDDDETPIVILKQGKLFGEINLVYNTPRVATVRARTHCDLVVLSKKDLDVLIMHYPEVGLKVTDAVKKRCALADETVGVYTEGHKESFGFQALRERSSSYVEPVSVKFPKSRVPMISISNQEHDRMYRMQKNWQRNLSFTGSVEILPLPVRTERESWLDSPLEMFASKRDALMKWLRETTFDPDSKGYILYDDILTIAVLIFSIVYPYMAFFTSEKDIAYLSTQSGAIILGVTYIMELFFLVDVFVSLRKSIITPHEKLTQFKDIVNHYVKSWIFVCDILSLLPLEHFNSIGIPRLWGHILREMLHVEDLFAIYSQMFTCLMNLCDLNATDTNWVAHWVEDRKALNASTSNSKRYIISLYFAIVTLTNTGYGDRVPLNSREKIFTMITMLIGFLVFGYGLAILAATITHIDNIRTSFQERLFAVSHFMTEHDLNKTLIKRVVRYFTTLWDTYQGEWYPGEENLLHEMPMNLQHLVNMEDLCPLLKQVPLFRHADDNFIKQVALCLVPYIFSPNEIVMYAKEPAREMYIIRRGDCEKVDPDGKTVISVLRPGDYFGATSMLYREYKTTSVRTKTYCEVYELKMSSLVEILKDFPLIENQFNHVMSDRLVLKTRNQGAAEAGDADDNVSQFTMSEEAFLSRPGIRHRKFLGIITFLDNGDVATDYKAPFKELNCRFSWILTYLNFFRYTMLPDGNLLMVWTIFMTVHSVVVVALTPVHIAFLHASIAMWIILYMLDLISLIHVFMVGPNTGFYNEENVLVLHPLATGIHYLKTNFLLDICGCLPYEFILLAVYHRTSWEVMHFMAFLRLNRLLLFYRFVMTFAYLEMDVYRETINLRKFKYIIYLCLFINLMGCFLFFVGCPPTLWEVPENFNNISDHTCFPNSWIYSRENFDRANATLFEHYVVSVYFSSVSMTAVGYGDFSSKLEHETVALSVVILAGQFIFTYILASITACVASADAQFAHFKEKMIHVKSYLDAQLINSALQKRVLDYYEHLWFKTKGVKPNTLFSVLPLSLWSDVTYSLYEDIISKISLFSGTEKSFIKTLSRCIKPIIILKNEFIVKKFDIGHEMYFIHHGAVDVVSEDGKTIFDTMNAGQTFGEVALLFSVPRTASIRAQVNCYLFMLEKGDLDMVLEFYPAIKLQITKIAEERRQQARKRSALKFAGKKVTDTHDHELDKVEYVDMSEIIVDDLLDDETEPTEPTIQLTAEKVRIPEKEIERESKSEDVDKGDQEAASAKKKGGQGGWWPFLYFWEGVRKKPATQTQDISQEEHLMSDRKSEQPTSDRKSQQPMSDRKSEQPIFDRKSQQPMSDRKSEQPMSDRKSEQPIFDRKSQQPMSDRKSEQPMSDRKSEQPIFDRKSQQPMSDRKSEQPMSDRKSEQPLSVQKYSMYSSSTDTGDEASSANADIRRKETMVESKLFFLSKERTSTEKASGPGDIRKEGTQSEAQPAGEDEEQVDTKTSPGLLKNFLLHSIDLKEGFFQEKTEIEKALDAAADSKEGSEESTANAKKMTACGVMIVSPQNKKVIYFRTLICVLGLFSCYLTSYQAAFQNLEIGCFVLAYFIDAFFIVEIWLGFHLEYYDPENRDLIDDPVRIRQNYLCRFDGFPMDFLTNFPFEILALAAKRDMWLPIITYIRLIRLLRIYSISKIFDSYNENLSSSMLVAKILYNLVAFTFTIHFVACLWFVLTCDSWLYKCTNKSMRNLIAKSYNGSSLSWNHTVIYFASLYWSVATVTTTGYGDVLPERLLEFCYVITVIIIGKCQIGFIIGGLTSALASADSLRTEYKERLDLFKKVLADRRAPPDLEKQMVRYYNQIWIHNKGIAARGLLYDLPICLRAEVMQTVAENFWKSIPYFSETDESFRRLLSLYVAELVFTEGDYIVRKGDLASELYFVKRGQLEEITDGNEPKILGRGNSFGGQGMLSNATYTETVRAITPVVVLSLSYKDLCKVLHNYPAIANLIKIYAKKVYNINFVVSRD